MGIEDKLNGIIDNQDKARAMAEASDASHSKAAEMRKKALEGKPYSEGQDAFWNMRAGKAEDLAAVEYDTQQEAKNLSEEEMETLLERARHEQMAAEDVENKLSEEYAERYRKATDAEKAKLNQERYDSRAHLDKLIQRHTTIHEIILERTKKK